MPKKNTEKAPEVVPVNVAKPAKYDELLEEIKAVDAELSKRTASREEYKKELETERAFIKNELKHAKTDREEAKSEDEYEAAEARIKHFTIKKNFNESQLKAVNEGKLTAEEYEHYKSILSSDYTVLLSDLRAKVYEKCAELFEVCFMYDELLEETNKATHHLNDESTFDYFSLDPAKLSICFGEDFYNQPGIYQHVLNAISKKKREEFARFAFSNMGHEDIKTALEARYNYAPKH